MMIRICTGFILILFLVFFLNSNFAGTLKLRWDPVSDNDIAGYKVYYGNNSRNYFESIDARNVTSYALAGLQECDIYYIAVTAYDMNGNESDYSNEVSGPAKRPLDTDNNNRIDGMDLLFLALHFGTQQEDPSFDSAADYNCDGWVDGDDLAILSAHFGEYL